MGTYINPGNEGFEGIIADEYVDKTGIIGLVNAVMNTPRKLVCVTRPRRFGKSFAAEAITAYYSCGCESDSLFAGLDISRTMGFRDHLNAYNVVRLDMSSFREASDIVGQTSRRLLRDLEREFPGVIESDAIDLAFLDVVRATGRKFVFVIDEWDAPLRESRSSASKEEWVYFLRLLFKNGNFTAEAVAAAYMTGILPLKRYGTQSALSDFWEYTMLNPADYAPYVGFTADEVDALATAHGMDMGKLSEWYDGYELPRTGHVYAPFSVMQACKRGVCASYWAASETFDSLRHYIDMDFDGLQASMVQLLGGAPVRVDTEKFDNDMHDLGSRDEVLTLLVHLGYLSYDFEAETVRIPNIEVRAELRRAMEESKHTGVAGLIRESDSLLQSTWDCDADAVAMAVGRVHDDYTAPLFYNDEQALRAVVKAAYISAVDHYVRVEELPGGRGFADIAYIPKHGASAPAMIIELKWNRGAESAIAQIRNREYPLPLRDWGGPVLLVGITYDAKAKTHTCVIEQL